MPKKKAKASASSKNGSEQDASTDAIELLKEQHKAIKGLIEKTQPFEATDEKLEHLRSVCSRWASHVELENEVLYPALRKAGVEDLAIDEAALEGDIASALLSDLTRRSIKDRLFVAGVNVLLRMLPRIIDNEESEPGGLYAMAKQADVDLQALERILKERIERDEHQAAGAEHFPAPRYLRVVGTVYQERGRFPEDDDRRGSRDYEERGMASRSRYDDDRDDRRGGYGDRAGYADASHRGWDERREGSRRDYDDEYERRRGSGRRYQG